MFEELKDVFALATGCTAFVNELLKIKNTKNKLQQNDNSGYSAQLASSGNSAQLASSGNSAQLASSGNSAQLASSGDFAQLASSGNSAQLASSGNSAQLASSGDFAQLASSGNSAKLASSGNWAKLASSGDLAQLASSGNSAKLASSGNWAKLASSGDLAKLASSGDLAKLASSGDSAQLESSGHKAVIAAIGRNSIAKAKKSSWITLAEYEKDAENRWVVSHVKTEYVDGEKIKEDTFYCLYKKDFQEVEIIDTIPTIILKRRHNVAKTKILGEDKEGWVFTKNNISAHGDTVAEAYRDWLFKTSPRDMSEYENLKLTDVKDQNYWAVCYRQITGACSPGTNYFIKNFKDKLKPEMSLQEVLEVTKGQYNSNMFQEFFKKKN